MPPMAPDESSAVVCKPIRCACLGNSILYYNDVPRLLEALSDGQLTQRSCLRGGATFTSLLDKGGRMEKLWRTPGAMQSDGSYDTGAATVPELLSDECDFVIMNDYTQGPARSVTLEQSVAVLRERYAPLLLRCGGVPVLLVTPAYRSPTKGSDDLGGPHEFTGRLMEGYAILAATLKELLPPSQSPRIAPVGPAFLIVHDEHPELWHEMFQLDHFHPSPIGTFLEAAVLYYVMFGKAPAAALDDASRLWSRARAMAPHGEDPLRMPTNSEMEYLCIVAARACNIDHTSSIIPYDANSTSNL